jgi:nucleotide-binding universal stress UspA family protein
MRFSIQESELRRIMGSLDPEETWTVDVTTGVAAPRITKIAEAHCAKLIVVGRHPHGLTDRIFGGETTLQVIRMSSVPVLTVNSVMKSVRTVVAAVDFSRASFAAAKEAIAMLSGSGILFLAVVTPSQELSADGSALSEEEQLSTDLASSFRHFIGALGSPRGTIVEPCVLTGRTISCVIECAERVGADLIAAGSHARSTLQRVLLGGVSAGLVRNAPCPVLVAPPAVPIL